MRKRGLRKGLIYLKALILVLAGVTILSSPAWSQEGLQKIADNVYSYVDVKNASSANSFGANAGIIVGKDGIVVIDTLISSLEAKRFIKDIRKISEKPIKYVINTHYHLDHTFGNSEFKKIGAVIIAQVNDQKNLKERGAATLKDANKLGLDEKALWGTELAYPNLSFTDKMEIDLENQKIELIYVGSSHTDGSILIYLPDKKILFTGDILFTNYHPYMGDGDLAGWVKTLDYLMTMEVNTIIPGHGPLSGKKDLIDMKNYLLAFDKKAKELCAQSNDLNYVAAEIKKALPPRAEVEFLISANLQERYLKNKQSNK